MPRLDRARRERLIPIAGTPPSLINVPPGCAFHPRCPYEEQTTGPRAPSVPQLLPSEPGHLVACHLPAATRRRIWETEIAPRLAADSEEVS